jgi:DNA-binding transcriptional regulator YhcF (GntR family)
LTWNLESDRPIYTQLVEQIELKIAAGIYKAGDKLPPVRDLAAEASVNPNTMQKALTKLEEDGLIITHRTNGRSITEDDKMIQQAKNKLAQNHVSEFLEKMQLMGFDKKDILVLITNMLEELKK